MGMFDDLIEQHAPKGEAAPEGGMFADLIAEHAPKDTAGDESMGAGSSETASAPPDMQGPSRFGLMADQAFHGGSVGALTDRINSGQVEQQAADQAFRAIVEARQAGSPVALRNFNPTAEEATKFANNRSALANPHVGVPLPELEGKFNDLTKSAADKRAAYDAERAKTKAAFDALPGTFDAPTLGGKVANVITDAGGMLVGGLANPENLIGGGGGRAVRQAGESAVKFALKAGAEDLGRGAVGGAVGGAVANPAVQAGEISRGEREKYEPTETLANAAFGAAIGGAFHVPGILARPILERIAAKRGVAVDKIDPDHVSREQFQEALKTDPQFAALAKGAGIEHANDLLALPAPGRAVKTDAEIGLERAATERGKENAAETPPILYGKEGEAPRTSDALSPKGDGTLLALEAPPIRVDREGNAFRADAGALEGRANDLPRAEIKPEEISPQNNRASVLDESGVPKEIDYANQKSSTKAPEPVEGKLATDPNGYVSSDKGGPVRFAQEKQADRFAVSQGKKTGQDFEIANHPSGKGFTVRERGRTEGGADGVATPETRNQDQPGGGRTPSESAGERAQLTDRTAASEPARGDAEAAPRAEAGLQKENVGQPSYDEQVKALSKREPGETTMQARDRAVNQFADQAEAEAAAHEAKLDEGSHDQIPFEHDSQGEPHGGDGNETGGEQPGRSEGERAGGQAEHGSEAAARHTDAGPDGGRQTVIPGAERLTDRELAERQGDKPLRGGDEPPPKGGLFDEDARNQKDMFDPKSTMHSGAIFDPAVWKWFGSKIAGDKYLREMRALAKDLKEDKADTRGRKTNKAADAARFVFYSVDGQMRALADAVKSPTLKNIADLFYAPADVGRGGAVGQTYHEAVTAQSGRNLNRLAAIMEKLGDKPTAFDQVVKLVQNPRSIKPGTAVHDAAAAIAKLLADEHAYLKKAGIDVGKVEGYYPREINVASVMKSGDAFRAAAERAYKASGLGAQEAKEAAEQWLSRVVLGGVNIRPEGTDFVHMGGTPSSKFSKGRELSKAADEIMAPFYHRDPLEALTTYFQRTARRAEWARRMGDYAKGPDGKPVFDELGKWKQMKADMIKEGNAAAVRQTVDMIASSTGANAATLPMGADSLIGMLKAYGTVKLLTHAAITSASESVLPAIRAGAPHRILTDIPRTVAALFAKSGKLSEQRAFAEDLGLIMRGAANGILAARYSAIDPSSRIRERIMNRNFRMSGLEQWTSATRVMAVNAAETFVRRLAMDVDGGRLRANSSRALLAELGVKDVAGFSKWVKDNDRALKGRDASGGGHSDTYRNAVTRFVHQSIMEVSASTRPQWANHPVGSLIFMLQSYNYAYQKNVTSRAYHQVASALSSKGGNLADRATMLSPLALIPAMFAIQMGLAPVRNAVFNSAHSKTLSDDDQLIHNMTQAASRSVTGALDPIVNLFTSAKYHSSSENTLGGPVAAGIGQLIDAVVAMTPKDIGGPNSDKTNAAERNLTRNIYDSAVAPAIVTAGALSPSWLGAILTQAPSLGPVKDAVIDSVAGAPTTQGSGRPQRPQRPTRPHN